MVNRGVNLLALLAGDLRPAVKTAGGTDIIAILRDRISTVKTALYDPDNSMYARSIAETKKRKQEEAAARSHLADFRRSQLTGNAAYDNLPDVKARRDKAESQYHWDRFAKSAPITQRMTQDQVSKAVDREGMSNFADSRVGKFVGNTLGTAAKFWGDAFGKGVGYLTSAPSGTTWADWSKGYDQAARQTSAQEMGHDIANNMQTQWNHLKRGAGDVGRFAAKWLDPRSWGSTTEARLNRQNHDNQWDNAQALTAERDRRLAANFNDQSLRDTSQGIGKWNQFGNGLVGELAGGTLATAGIGGVAKGVGSGIGAGARTLGGVAGRATAGAVNATARAARIGQASGRACQFAARAGNAVNRGVQEMGKVVSMPFDTVGALANPASALQKSVGTVAKPVGQIGGAAVKGGYQTARAALRPGVDLLHTLRHPVANMRSAGQYALQHPFGAAGRTMQYGGKYMWDVGSTAARGLYGTAKPAAGTAWKAIMHPTSLYGQTLYGSYNDAREGNYGAAVRNIADMGIYGALRGKAGLGYIGMQMAAPFFTGSGQEE